jgi:membrane protein DedA with SNARE-associated domain
MLADLSETIQDAVVEAGYVGLAVVMAVETVFPPIPSEIVLPFAGFQVAQGTLGFLPALLASTLGAVAGALVLYAIARLGGRALVLKLHPLLRIGEQDLDKADRWFDSRAVPIVLFGRLVPGIRSLVSVPAGLAEMPVLTFLCATAAGALLWNSALLGAGVLLGANHERVERYVGPLGTVVLGAVALACVAGVVWLRRRGAAA